MERLFSTVVGDAKLKGLLFDKEAFLMYYIDMEPLPIVKLGLTYINNPSNAKALDYGAGAGRNAVYLARQGLQVLAVDKNQNILETIPTNDHLQIKCADITKWQIPGAFDYVIATNILHFFNPEIASDCIKKIATATSENGILALTYIIDKKESVPQSVLEAINSYYQTIVSETKTVKDPGHPGMPEPHKHTIFYYLGRKISQ